MFKYGEKSLEMKTTEVMDKCENLINAGFKASGISVMDVLTDAETGAMIGGCIELYKSSKELVVMQAKSIDRLTKDFEELKAMNEDLLTQNDRLQQLLQDLNRKVENIEK